MNKFIFLSILCVLIQIICSNSFKLDRFRIKSGKQHNSDLNHVTGFKMINLRGGFDSNHLIKLSNYINSNPSSYFNGIFTSLFSVVAICKIVQAKKSLGKDVNSSEKKPSEVLKLQINFLSVFWLLRMADWLQGPYFYEVYASKFLNGKPLPFDMVSKLFLVGFASTGIFGPWIGRFIDGYGRKLGTILFTVLYTLGALSTRSAILLILLLGRVAGGIGTSLLFSAPEAWLVAEFQKLNVDSKWLGETFGWAYSGDSLVAIAAGQIASLAAFKQGPTGPFTLSVAFLIFGAILASFNWKENTAPQNLEVASEKKMSIKDAITEIAKDKKILLVGLVQALFEGAMYIFVLQWPPALTSAIQSTWGQNTIVPYGKIFSCFMASCLLGSTLFGSLQKSKYSIEDKTMGMLGLASVSMAIAAKTVKKSTLSWLMGSFLFFEVCVGMYFPSIGSLRAKYIPDKYRSVIMNLFGIPLNLIVVTVFLSIKKLGIYGALAASTICLFTAFLSMSLLSITVSENKTGKS